MSKEEIVRILKKKILVATKLGAKFISVDEYKAMKKKPKILTKGNLPKF